MKLTLAIWAIGTLLQDAGVIKTADFTPMKKEINTSIVAVYVPGSRGTGFFVEFSGNKYLITAAHVCAQSPILVSDRGLHRVLTSRPDKDLCIATTYQGVSTLELGEDPKNGDAVIMNGFPGPLEYDVQSGTARDVRAAQFMFPMGYYNEAGCPPLGVPNTEAGTCQVFVTTTGLEILARGGNSGGPIQDATTGKVVGVIIGGDRAGSYGLSVPVSELMGIFEGRP